MLLAVPLAWVAAEAERGGHLPWEKLVLAAVFLLPLVVRPIATLAGIPIAPPLLIALLWVVARRAAAVPALLGKLKPVRHGLGRRGQ
jgi:alpha-1,2-mannosyltransferase